MIHQHRNQNLKTTKWSDNIGIFDYPFFNDPTASELLTICFFLVQMIRQRLNFWLSIFKWSDSVGCFDGLFVLFTWLLKTCKIRPRRMFWRSFSGINSFVDFCCKRCVALTTLDRATEHPNKARLYISNTYCLLLERSLPHADENWVSFVVCQNVSTPAAFPR